MFKRGIVISPVYLSVENPALLSFQIFSKYHGGVWLFDNEEGSQIQQFDSSGPITGAST